VKTIGVFILLCLAVTVYGQDAVITGYPAEVLREIDGIAGRITQLAEAVPEELYDWRPAEGVRSFREIFLHLAGGNYSLPGLIGYQPPEWYERGKFEKTVFAKDEVIEVLKASFEHQQTAIASFTDADMDTAVRWFGGRETTRRAALLSMTRHAGEHLGQLIAYARMNGVVPPWSR
jgi:uncharacterized damage-inducible protein DinB